ncbi:helix-turn-helix transcriptional regulator [Photobacterium ganghwense]|uniref:helix-turn-helix transcriptional regulator n=1 Tax=Photobacterium ganghwense TaxID=320778 RepID=UPI0040563665
MDNTREGNSKSERLEFIEFLVQFKGWVNRPDLVDRFGISAPVATRELKNYRDAAPDNLRFNDKLKRYEMNECFTPRYPITTTKALSRLRSPQIIHIFGWDDTLSSGITPPRLALPRPEVLMAITRGITNQQKVEICYFSVENGNSTRTIVPHSIFDTGLKWYVRAFDEKRKTFIDFSLSRIEKAVHHIENPTVPNIQYKDQQWLRELNLEISPHPHNVKSPETIHYELGMTDGYKLITVKAALAGYWLRLWNVDCSRNQTLQGNEYQLYLKNAEALYDVSSAKIAPGHGQ